MLEIKNLTAGYKKTVPIIKGVNITVKEGEIVCIIGPNGAGKSTVLKSIFGLTKIESGSVNFFGENLVNCDTSRIIERGISYIPQGRTVFPSLTVEENLEMGFYIKNDSKKLKEKMEEMYSLFPKLYARKSQQTRLMSGGEQQMVSFARSLMLNPKLLLLDEPSIGLSPIITDEIFTLLQKIKSQGVSILIVEQNAKKALSISDRGYVLELGENRLEGTGKSLLANEEVGALYLGKR